MRNFTGNLALRGKINRQLIFEAGLPPPSVVAPFFAESEYLGILSFSPPVLPEEERARRKIISKATRKKRQEEAGSALEQAWETITPFKAVGC